MLQFINLSFLNFVPKSYNTSMKRDILKIDEDLCNGCGQCVPNCHEGALQVIDGKVRLVSELMCDGLGACIGHCPEGAIVIESREAEPYNEVKVMEQMVSKGKNTIIAHLKHLKDHGETGFLQEGVNFLKGYKDELGFDLPEVLHEVHNHGLHQGHAGGGCPGSKAVVIGRNHDDNPAVSADQPSELRQWPVQMHLINPAASYFNGADLLVAADCAAFSYGNFHNHFIKGKKLVIACPKLDQGKDIYVQKLVKLIDDARVNTITVVIMEVPCCGGLSQMVQMATQMASRRVPVKQVVIGIKGDVLSEEWI